MACVAGVETGRIGGIKGRGIGECGKGMVFHSNVAHLGAKTVAQKEFNISRSFPTHKDISYFVTLTYRGS